MFYKGVPLSLLSPGKVLVVDVLWLMPVTGSLSRAEIGIRLRMEFLLLRGTGKLI